MLPSASCVSSGWTALCDRYRKNGLLLALQKGDGVVVEDVGGVALHLDARAVDVQVGIEVRALSLEAHPVMKTGPRRFVDAHVPLADERVVVAGLFQLPRKGLQPVAERRVIAVVDHAVHMRILPGEERRPAGRAQRRGDERVAKGDALVRNAVDIGTLDERVADAAQLIPAQVIHEDEDDVRLARRRRQSAGAERHEAPPRERRHWITAADTIATTFLTPSSTLIPIDFHLSREPSYL